jgi:predicted TIM-barrel fold metal-dependent hydrolase
VRVPPVDLSPLPAVVKNAPGARLVLLNTDSIQNSERLRKLYSFDNVYFDLSMIEGVNGVARIAKAVSSQRILFGSNCPLFYFESALFKVREADCTDAEKRAILEGNARGLLVA